MGADAHDLRFSVMEASEKSLPLRILLLKHKISDTTEILMCLGSENFLQSMMRASVVLHSCHPSLLEAETCSLQVQGQPRLLLSKKEYK